MSDADAPGARMDKLRPDDHFMVLLEGAETPMHIGSLLTLEVPEAARATAAERLVQHLCSRLPATPLLRVLQRAPLGFDSDVWVPADGFDPAEQFIVHRDGHLWDDADLHAFIEREVMVRLDLSRPPFLVHVVDPV